MRTQVSKESSAEENYKHNNPSTALCESYPSTVPCMPCCIVAYMLAK